MVNATELKGCIESLRSMTSEPCHYVHECSTLNDPAQCNSSDQERCLGCAHSGLVILQTTISALESHGVISPERATALWGTLVSTFEPVVRLDIQAMHEYEQTGQISPATVAAELQIIKTRGDVRDELLALAGFAQLQSC